MVRLASIGLISDLLVLSARKKRLKSVSEKCCTQVAGDEQNKLLVMQNSTGCWWWIRNKLLVNSDEIA
jgi:hypothetical protein